MIKNSILLGIIVVFFSGCTTIVGSSTQEVVIDSFPTGANVVITDRDNGDFIESGVTPMNVELLKGEPGFFSIKKYILEFSKEDKKSTMNLTPNISLWYILGNFFSFGIVGWIIDSVTGKQFVLPDNIKKNINDIK